MIVIYTYYYVFSGLVDEEAVDDVSIPPASPRQSPPHPGLEEEGETEVEDQQPPAKRPRRKGPLQRKQFGWSIPDQQEQELVEWLQSNTYLWLRSTKDYHRKKSAWEQKAQELNISLKHLQNWWKNVKDWFVKLSKKTSGQATRVLTDRDQWILKNIAFYKSKYISLSYILVHIPLNSQCKGLKIRKLLNVLNFLNS